MEQLSAQFVNRLLTGKPEDQEIRKNGIVLALDPNEPELGEIGTPVLEPAPDGTPGESIFSMLSPPRPMTKEEIDHYLDIAS